MLNLRIGTINCRTLSSRTRIAALEEATMEVPFDIIGLCSTQRRGYEVLKLQLSGHMIFFSDSTGFLVNKKWINCCFFHPLCDRVSYIDILTKTSRFRVIQVYAPTTDYADNEYADFLQTVSEALLSRFQSPPQIRYSTYKVVVGDFNAKVGCGELGKNFIGPYGLGTRNRRGNTLASFCSENELYLMNNRFPKRLTRKWTWISPNMKTRNAIDFVLSTNPSIFLDVDIIGRFHFDSDHRLVMAKIRLPSQFHYFRNNSKCKTVFNRSIFRSTLKQLATTADLSNYEQLKATIKIAATVATSRTKETHISDTTRKLYEIRHRLLHEQSAKNAVEFSIVSKALRLSLKTDIEQKHLMRLHQAISRSVSLRRALQANQIFTRTLTQLRKEDGSVARSPADVAKAVQEFYSQLFSSKRLPASIPWYQLDDVPPILADEVSRAVKKMKLGKAPGPDLITAESLITGYDVVKDSLIKLFNDCLEREKLPITLSDSSILLLFKKGEQLDINNYRPIALLSVIYKVFSSIILQRMMASLEINQPIEQAGFRRNFSTLDHIHVINQLVEKSLEYNFPLYIAFVDYSKAFDSVEHNMIWTSLHRQGVHPKIIRLLSNIYTSASVTFEICGNQVPINARRGVRQGDPISPSLFTAVLETVFRSLDWRNRGININGLRLSHLRYADDVVLFAHKPQELELMLQEMSDKSQIVGLRMNFSKTLVMTNSEEIPISTDGSPIHYCSNFVYLGQCISFDRNLTTELNRRIRSGWNSFNRFRSYFTNRRFPMKFKRRLYTKCVEPCLLYGCETWATRSKDLKALQIAQRQIMRRMLGVTLLMHRTNLWLENTAKLPDIRARAIERKWTWARKMCTAKDNRWTKMITEWRPWIWKRQVGRPKTRWRDSFVSDFGETWMRTATTDVSRWRQSMQRHIVTL
ncbi:hypothetical protein RB195_009483 [Necator americanus]|uniref:Reverse transcriptase domain-containing protein n=2 Tax=Necator americanus TaxID=51031 RepID=A0ABR1CTI5_NECAM